MKIDFFINNLDVRKYVCTEITDLLDAHPTEEYPDVHPYISFYLQSKVDQEDKFTMRYMPLEMTPDIARQNAYIDLFRLLDNPNLESDNIIIATTNKNCKYLKQFQ